MEVRSYNGVEIVLEESPKEFAGSVVVTGFRGFGMVGYNVSKYLALGLGARKVGFVVSEPMPPIIVMEEDDVGFPYDIYYSDKARTLVFVNRALPEKDTQDKFTRAIAAFSKDIGARFAILAGGLDARFRPDEDEHGYRYIANKYYEGPKLEAPQMEEDLGVMGPLALLYIYMTLYEVPALIILPYAIADQIDVAAARRGIEIISRKLLGVEVDMSSLDQYEEKLEIEKEKIMKSLMPILMKPEEESEEDRRKGIYM